MHTNRRSRAEALIVFVLLIGMGCSLLGIGVENPNQQGEQATPPPMPTLEGVVQSEAPIPLPPDAADFSSSQDSFSYTTQLSVEDVASFYQKELPLQGWTIEEQGNAGGMLMWTISREDSTYLLSIMPSNGMTIVNAAPIQ